MSLPPLEATDGTWKVAFVCDLGRDVGVGHVMRCLALAEECHQRGHRVQFVTDAPAVPMVAEQLAARGFAVVAPPPVEELTSLLAGLAPDLVVVDSYRLPLTAYDDIRAAGMPLLALVDGDPGGRAADLYLDQNIGAEHDRWPLAEGAQRLAGLEFALQRREVAGLRPKEPAREEASPLRVLAFFGGTDAYGIAPDVAAALVATGAPFELTVIAARDEMRTALAAITPGVGQSITTMGPSDQLAALVVEHDVSLAAAGSSLWELACLGTAAAVICVVDNQREAYQRVVDSDLFVGLGSLDELRADSAYARDRLATLLQDAGMRAGLRARSWRSVDGRGAYRVVEATAELVGSRAPE